MEEEEDLMPVGRVHRLLAGRVLQPGREGQGLPFHVLVVSSAFSPVQGTILWIMRTEVSVLSLPGFSLWLFIFCHITMQLHLNRGDAGVSLVCRPQPNKSQTHLVVLCLFITLLMTAGSL